MATYPLNAFSIGNVRNAGETLRPPIVVNETFDPVERERVIEAFAIANSWRDSHVYPMRSVRLSILHRMRRMGVKGLTAARPKRMSSIRRKLATSTIKLDQMQDLGGCRVIADDYDGVQAIITSIHNDFPHTIRKEHSYINHPKDDGYRSHHVMFNYVGRGKNEPFDGRRIELQVRTRLQHSWATAVEAVGLFRGEDLKHGSGNEDWLRLFALVSAEFAFTERCPVSINMPERSERLRELRELNRRLHATDTLENIKAATNFAENYVYTRGMFYLIRYGSDHTVSVESYNSPIASALTLGIIEQQIEIGANDSKVVLVEVDKIDKLIETYPAYFGDVGLFVRNLKSVCEGRDAIEYSMLPQERVPTRRVEQADPSTLRRRYTKWFDDWTGNRR